MDRHDFEIGFLDSSATLEDANKAPRIGGNGHLLDVYSQTIVDVVKEVGPSVIHVHVQHKNDGSIQSRGKSEANGSGLIITPDGYIVTNMCWLAT
jgi:S1-C subfamily serine protease